MRAYSTRSTRRFKLAFRRRIGFEIGFFEDRIIDFIQQIGFDLQILFSRQAPARGLIDRNERTPIDLGG